MKYFVCWDKTCKNYDLVLPTGFGVEVEAKKVSHARNRGWSKLKNATVAYFKNRGLLNNEKIFREYLNTLAVSVTKIENEMKKGA